MHENFLATVNLKSSDIRNDMDAYGDASKHLWNEAIYLTRQDLLEDATEAGIDIPDKYFYEATEGEEYRNLNDLGVNWLHRELRTYRMNRTKDWISILMPVLSLVVAILGLLVALKKR